MSTMGSGGSIPGRPPGEYAAWSEDGQEFVAEALYCKGAMSLRPNTPAGPAAVGTVVAVPEGQQPALDHILAAHEREAVELDITSSWTAMGMPSRTVLGSDVVIARLDLQLAGPTVPTVLTRIFFGDVRGYGEALWAAALARRVLLFGEPAFRRVVLQIQEVEAVGSEGKILLGSGGLEIGNLGGCGLLRVALERAGVEDEIFEGRCA